MGRGPKVWLATDQTKTSVVYIEILRGLLPRSVGVSVREFALIPYQRSVGPSVGSLVTGMGGFDPKRDRVLVVHDWENDRTDEQDRSRRERVCVRIRALLERKLGVEPHQVWVWLVPPTTEGLYFMLAELGFTAVRKCLADVPDRDVKRLGAQRMAVARAPSGPAPGPRKLELDQMLCLRGPRKVRLAEQVAAAIKRDLATSDVQSRLDATGAVCMSELVELSRQLAR